MQNIIIEQVSSAGLLESLIPILTAIILLAAFVISYLTYLNETRPVTKLSLESDGLKMQPTFINETRTEAIGIVYFRIIGRLGKYPLEPDRGLYQGIYSGKCVWLFPAKSSITGNFTMHEAVQKATGSMHASKAKEPFLEAYVYYRKWSYSRHRLLELFRLHKLLSIYSTPVYMWQWSNEGQWVFVPAHKSVPHPPKVELDLLFGSIVESEQTVHAIVNEQKSHDKEADA